MKAVFFNKQSDIAEVLIQNGANIDKHDFKSGKTALHFAAMRGNQRVAEILLKKGAKVNIKDSYDEKTPLEIGPKCNSVLGPKY